jgi:hypothetical protein
MKAFIVSRTPSVRKAMGTPGRDGCPFSIYHHARSTAQEVCDHMNERYAIGFKVFEVEVKIIKKTAVRS